jgi:hypothetical protein
MRPEGDAGPISRNRNPANGEVGADSPSCVNPTGGNKKDDKRIERKPKARIKKRVDRKPKARITKRVSGIAFPPDKNWVVDDPLKIKRRAAKLSTSLLSGKSEQTDPRL